MAVTRLAALTLLLLAVSACQAADWTHRHGADHTFAGAIVDLRSQRVIDEAALLAALGNADIVLLGETHDNRDHHLLQARLVGAMGSSVNGVVFEMIDTDRQQAVIEHLQEHPRDTAGLGAAIGWEESGWPDWSMYEPIAAATLAIDAQIVAGSLPREAIQGLLADGTKGLDPALAERTGLTEPLEPMLEANMLATISEAVDEDDLSLESVERRHILRVLDMHEGNKSAAARVLGVSRKTLERKCQAWGVGG